MIFLSIVGAWTALVQYDRREKRIATQKWTRLVSDLKNDTLPITALQRKLTIVLAAPPADSIIVAREHFHEYIKPVLEETGLDWDAIEGRREGEVRAGLAERIRKLRQKKGEQTTQQLEDWEILLDDIRGRMGVKAVDGVAGDIVIGRHTWKEYVRGLHEGWLGPMDPTISAAEAEPPAIEATIVSETATNPPSQPPNTSDDPLALASADDDASPTAAPSDNSPESPPDAEKKAEEEANEQKKKKRQPAPYIATSEYSSASLSPNCPEILGPSDPIPFPHLLGFFNFPIRIHRYLHKRRLADTIGRQTAAAALAVYRPYDGSDLASPSSQDQFFYSSQSSPSDAASGSNGFEERSNNDGERGAEMQYELEAEEKEWHKTIRNRTDPPEEGKEYTWTNGMVLDPRIANRMRRFVLTSDEEERAKVIDAQIRQEKWDKMLDVPARILRGAVSTFRGTAPASHPLDSVGDSSDVD